MKHTLIALSLCFAFYSAESQKFNYGMFIGGSFSSWNNDIGLFIEDLEYEMNSSSDISNFHFENNNRIGVSIGGFIEFYLNEHLLIHPELSYIQKGTRLIGSGVVSGTYMDMNMVIQTDYLEVPLLIKYCPVKKESLFKPYLLAGPNISYSILSKMKATAKSDDNRESDTVDFIGLEDLNYGFSVGGGFKFTEISLEIRYQKGLTQTLTKVSSEGMDLKADVIMINLVISMF